jgi:hypothetical protein
MMPNILLFEGIYIDIVHMIGNILIWRTYLCIL